MSTQLVPNALICIDNDTCFARRDELGLINLPLTFADISILEAFTYSPTLTIAHAFYRSIDIDSALQGLLRSEHLSNLQVDTQLSVRLGSNCLRTKSGFGIDLHSQSRNSPGTLCALCLLRGLPNTGLTPLSEDDFKASIDRLSSQGLLAPGLEQIDIADVRRLFPVDQWFGHSRGLPIDRYYLDKFISRIRPSLHGQVLEIGGSKELSARYNFTVETHSTLDLVAPADYVGDASQESTFPPQSWDVVLCFNVLEHCRNPQQVVRNIHTWLKPGGFVAALSPVVQRVHHAPKDYWRFMPDGTREVFTAFAEVELVSYGNPLACAAALFGISANELTEQELDFSHPEYPVALGAICKKT